MGASTVAMSLSALTQGHVVVLAGLLALVLIVGVLFIMRQKPFLAGVGKCVFRQFCQQLSLVLSLGLVLVRLICACYGACPSLEYA